MEKYDIHTYYDSSETNKNLRMYGELDYTRVHGPGNRYSLWLQGCLKRCPGCSNIQMLDIEESEKYFVGVSEMVDKVINARDSVYKVEGITIQGGEPMIQAKNLSYFLEELHQRDPNLNVLLFSGYKRETLENFDNPHVQKVLYFVNTLIDGVFESTQRDHELIRGSENQMIHHLNDGGIDGSLQRYGREVTFHPSKGKKTSTGIRLKNK